MGTSNFYNKNARKVYAVLMNYETPVLDDDGDETEEMELLSSDHSDVERLKWELTESAKRIAQEGGVKYHEKVEISDPHDLQSYGSTTLFQLYTKDSFGDVSVELGINAVLRGAYYEGASLDWYISCNINGNPEELDDVEFDLDEYTSNMNAGLRVIQARNIEKWIERNKEPLIELMEKIFTENSMPLVVTERFSNGETFYSKAS